MISTLWTGEGNTPSAINKRFVTTNAGKFSVHKMVPAIYIYKGSHNKEKERAGSLTWIEHSPAKAVIGVQILARPLCDKQ